MKVASFCLLAVVLTSPMVAQQTSQPKPEDKNGKLFVSSERSIEMKKMIDSFAGLWRTTINVYKGNWFPKDATVKGRSDIRSGPAGNSLTERISSISDMGSFAGHGVYWYDKQGGGYRGLWCDSMDLNGCGPVGNGAWEGDKLIFNNEMQMGNGTMKVRETFSNITKNSFDFVLESTGAAGQFSKQMSIHYERRSADADDR